jgi:hypothetical protein
MWDLPPHHMGDDLQGTIAEHVTMQVLHAFEIVKI